MSVNDDGHDIGTAPVLDPAVMKTAVRPRSPHKPVEFDHFMAVARQAVVSNYNEHSKDPRGHGEGLTSLDVHLVWCNKVVGNWKAGFMSTRARGLLWEVSLSGVRNELYVDVFTKLNNIRISLGEDGSS